MLTLISLLFVCHWIGDYTQLQTPWMLRAKMIGSPLFPIFVHALTHALLMGAVLWFYTEGRLLAELFVFQLVSHFLIDVWKGKMNIWFPTLKNPMNQSHWVIFGIDQLLHQLVIVGMVAWLYKA